jgi:hypothetical protein
VIAFLYGRGADGATCACDANHDGTTNPTPINGNNLTSLSADDDGGFFRDRAATYYRTGAASLPFAGAPAPTATRTPAPPTATPTTAAATSTPVPATPVPPTRTPVPQTATAIPTNPPPSPTPNSAPIRVTFDDMSGQNRPLNGQYPSGVIDWGSGAWYLSGPWGAFSTKSLSFANNSISNATLQFVAPRRLVSLRAYNGRNTAATVTLSCAGQPTTQTTIPARGVVTIATNWTGTCTNVTIATTNTWWTNFDDLMLYPS